jgi:hypothetical protein
VSAARRRSESTFALWGRVALYGAALAAGAIALQWLDYQWIVRAHARDVYLFLAAAAFLVLGIYIGARVLHAPPRPPAPKARGRALVPRKPVQHQRAA